jgi:membrane protein YdbS with pleckstrin-like domain
MTFTTQSKPTTKKRIAYAGSVLGVIVCVMMAFVVSTLYVFGAMDALAASDAASIMMVCTVLAGLWMSARPAKARPCRPHISHHTLGSK